MKKVPILTVAAILLGFALILASCNSSSSGGGSPKIVQYTVSGENITNNADKDDNQKDPLTGTDFRFLTWFCGTLDQDQNKQIKLTFKKQNGIWVLDKKDVSGGDCR